MVESLTQIIEEIEAAKKLILYARSNNAVLAAEKLDNALKMLKDYEKTNFKNE